MRVAIVELDASTGVDALREPRPEREAWRVTSAGAEVYRLKMLQQALDILDALGAAEAPVMLPALANDLVKPLFDGAIAAFHRHEGNAADLEIVSTRIAPRLPETSA